MKLNVKHIFRVAVCALTGLSLSTIGASHHTKHIGSRHTAHTKKKSSQFRTLPGGIKITKGSNDAVLILPQKMATSFQTAMFHRSNLVTPFGVPGASISSPNAFGPSGTVLLAGAGYVNHWTATNKQDGYASVGASFGNPYRYVGVLVNVVLSSVGINNSDFAEHGNLSIRINRYLDQNTAIAVGAGNAVGWGIQDRDAHNFYAAITHTFVLGLPMSFNFGIGTGAFNNVADVSRGYDGNVKPFASLGIGVYKNASIVGDWTANQFSFGGNYTFTCWRKVPIFIGLYGVNLNHNRGLQAYFQGVLGISYLMD